MEFSEYKELLKGDRSYRRFDHSYRISKDTLKELVDLTRYCASGRNLQPLKYLPVYDEEECEALFGLLKWAGYLPDWDGPAPDERPSAYLIQCLDTRLTTNPLCDEGLQLQAVTLGARAMGLGCCIIKAFDRDRTAKLFALPEYLVPEYVLAVGKPIEKVVIEDTDGSLDADIKYYRDAEETHHVPKRPLREIMIERAEKD